MRALTSEDILGLWDSGGGLSPLDRALLLLGKACPEKSPEELGALSIDRRDQAFFALREATLGRSLQVFGFCDRCKARAEFQVDTVTLREKAPLSDEEHLLQDQGWRIRYRLPTSADLAQAMQEENPALRERRLLGTCVLESSFQEESREFLDFPADTLARLEEAIAESGERSEIRLQFDCPSCGCSSSVLLDIASILWEELSAMAERLLLEVHLLASAYGWSEKEILSLSPHRRQAYLERVS